MTPTAVCVKRSESQPRESGSQQPDQAAVAQVAPPSLLLIGNPNVGKSVIFHWLTGRYATVSNYPGTTVAVSRGKTLLAGQMVDVSDTPGLNSLLAGAEDERVTRRLLLDTDQPIVLQVADAKNLERALVVTLELGEAHRRVVLDLNMADEARERRIRIDTEQLARQLGIPVVMTIATQRWGCDQLRTALSSAARPTYRIRYPAPIEEAAERLAQALPNAQVSRRAWALLWLAGDDEARQWFERAVEPSDYVRLAAMAERVRHQFRLPVGVAISESRLRAARAMAAEVTSREPTSDHSALRRIGRLALHHVWGPVIALGVMALIYWVVGVFGAQTLVGLLEEQLFGRVINPAVSTLVRAIVPVPWMVDLLIGEYGLVTMALTYSIAIILPIVSVFFLCFGFLEDVGYLPRLVVIADRACRLVGLNGKAVLPLVLGFGCDTMATMTARTLESRREQVIATLLLALAVPCSAQLGVIFAMLAGLPPAAGWIWLTVVTTSFFTAGHLASRLVGGEPTPLLYEIPPLRWPKPSNILIKTLGRVEWYLREAVPLFVLGTLVLFVSDRMGLLAILQAWVSPVVVSWLGLPPRAAEALLAGFLRRDFGAAGFFAMRHEGLLTPTQVVVSLVTITLFVPCFAQYLVMVKERGWKTATVIATLVTAYAVAAGGVVRWVLQSLRVNW